MTIKTQRQPRGWTAIARQGQRSATAAGETAEEARRKAEALLAARLESLRRTKVLLGGRE